MPPLLLLVTTVDTVGFISSFAGSGLVLGSVVVAFLGRPRHAVMGILVPLALQGISMLSAVCDAHPWLIGAMGFVSTLFIATYYSVQFFLGPRN